MSENQTSRPSTTNAPSMVSIRNRPVMGISTSSASVTTCTSRRAGWSLPA